MYVFVYWVVSVYVVYCSLDDMSPRHLDFVLFRDRSKGYNEGVQFLSLIRGFLDSWWMDGTSRDRDEDP